MHILLFRDIFGKIIRDFHMILPTVLVDVAYFFWIMYIFPHIYCDYGINHGYQITFIWFLFLLQKKKTKHKPAIYRDPCKEFMKVRYTGSVRLVEVHASWPEHSRLSKTKIKIRTLLNQLFLCINRDLYTSIYIT